MIPQLQCSITRFAPSPSGGLHLGHVAAALFARERAAGGRFLVRMEDIDAGRCRPAFAEAMLEELAWLGLHWDGAVRRQSAHMAEYAAVLRRLEGMGVLYPCFCTRADVAREVAAAGQAPHGPEGAVYPGTCRRLPAAVRAARMAAGEAHAWRLDMAAAVTMAGRPGFHEVGVGWVESGALAFGDVVLARRDVPASYHLCVTHDDAVQGVTLVTRGMDLRPAASVQRVLQVLMGWPEPAYAHHRLLVGADGRRLAKRDGAATVAAMRAAGMTAEAVLAAARAGLAGVDARGERGVV